MVTPDEQRAVQLENAKDDASFFAGIRDMHQGPVDDHKSLATTVANAIRDGEASVADADRVARAAQERAERIEHGEDVAGGLGKPRTHEDFEKALRAGGFTRRDWRRVKMIAAVGDLGPEVMAVFMQAATYTEFRNRHVARRARATLKLFGGLNPADRVAVAKAMLEANKSHKPR
jgi:hypothetical protein